MKRAVVLGVWICCAGLSVWGRPVSERLGISTFIGDPISASDGVCHFALPLLDMGGPMDMRLELSYYTGWNTSHGLRCHFENSLIPAFSRIWNMVGGDQNETRLYLPFEAFLVFTNSPNGTEWYLPDAAPVKYTLQESGTWSNGWFFLANKATGRLYVFEKVSSGATTNLTWTRIVSVWDRSGNSLAYTYDSPSALAPVRIEDGYGRTLDFALQGGSYLTNITDHAGRTVAIEQETGAADLNGNAVVRSVSSPGGNTTVFHYQYVANLSWLAPLSGVTRSMGNTPYTQTVAGVTLDGLWMVARVTSQYDAYSNVVTIAYDPSTNRVIETRPDGTVVAYSHLREKGPPASVTDSAGHTAFFSATKDEQIAAMDDREGGRTSFGWQEDSGLLAVITNAAGGVFRHTYSPATTVFTNPASGDLVTNIFFDLVRTDYPDGTCTVFTNDVCGRPIRVSDPAGYGWSLYYNPAGLVTQSVNPAGGYIGYAYSSNMVCSGWADSDSRVVTYRYDAAFRMTVASNAFGGCVSFQYDADGRVTNSVNERGYAQSFAYDANGNLIKHVDELGRATTYGYDLLDRLVVFSNRIGGVTTYRYDSMGRLESITTAAGLAESYRYDGLGKVTNIVQGGLSWAVGYNQEGVAALWRSPMGYTMRMGVNPLGFMTNWVDSAGAQMVFEHDAMGRITRMSDSLNRSRQYDYDPRGMVSNISYQWGGSNVFSYTSHGRLASLSDFNGRVWSFQYSPLGRIESVSDPEGRTTHYAYNANGWLTEIAYPNAATQWVSYDATGNPTNRRYSGGLTLPYAYDAAGRFVGNTNLTLDLDAEGGVTGTVMNGRAYHAFYHPDGALKMVSYNDGAFSVAYQYDPTNGMLVSVADSLFAGEVTFNYDADRRLIGVLRQNGLNTGYTLDSEGRILRVEDGGVLNLQYGYNAAGQTTQLVAVAPILAGTALPASSLITGAYDRASAITSEIWCVDELGRVTNGPFGAVVWDDASRLIQTADAVLTYDESGNVISRESTLEGHKRYDYQFAVAGHPPAAVETVADGSMDHFVWTPEGELLYMIKTNPSPRAYYFHFDAAGSTRAISDSSGMVVNAYAYTPEGRIVAQLVGERQPFTFMGRYGVRQEGTGGLYQARARYYHAGSGRFLSRDPIWPGMEWPEANNPYQYALNDPIDFADVDGAEFISVSRMLMPIRLPNPALFMQARAQALGKSWTFRDIGVKFCPRTPGAELGAMMLRDAAGLYASGDSSGGYAPGSIDEIAATHPDVGTIMARTPPLTVPARRPPPSPTWFLNIWRPTRDSLLPRLRPTSVKQAVVGVFSASDKELWENSARKGPDGRWRYGPLKPTSDVKPLPTRQFEMPMMIRFGEEGPKVFGP